MATVEYINWKAVSQTLEEMNARIYNLQEAAQQRDAVFANLHQEIQDLKRQMALLSVENKGSGPTA